MSTKARITARNASRPLPQYRKDAKYPGHKLIEALPDVPTTDEAYRALRQCPPDRLADFRALPVHRKLDLHGDLRLLFLPTAEHVSGLQKIVRAIRDGLAYRDLSDPRVQAALYRSWRGEKIGLARLNPSGGGCLGLLLQGVTGSGKTSFVDRVYAYLTKNGTQPVIWHRDIEGRPCFWPQITCLRIQCQTTVKATVAELTKQIDALLSTDHRSRLRSGMSTGLFIAELCQILSIHFVGILIVEDMQKLHTPEHDVLEYFCDLMEESGIPVLLVSTYKFRPVLARDPTLLSKLTAGGELDFGLMSYDPEWVIQPDLENDDWTPFITALWEMNTFSRSTPMPPWLPSVVHFHTQGIRRITRELFASLFDRVAYVEKAKVTETLIDDIAKTELAKYQNGLNALRQIRIQGQAVSDAQAQLVEHYLLPSEDLRLLQEQVKSRQAESRASTKSKAAQRSTTNEKPSGQSKSASAQSRKSGKTSASSRSRNDKGKRATAPISNFTVYQELKRRGKVVYSDSQGRQP